ncbi:fimbrial protein [Pseudomonas sp. Xaverov 259]|uniref:fimbrial protein n=1 Tax=Pseudomonas sp. Xaverov 259 TaxID=2666086 RepID=UPI0034D5E471
MAFAHYVYSKIEVIPMKRSLLACSLLAATFGMSVAHAADGTINFTGEISGQTCTTTVNGSATPTVILPKVSTASLAAVGATGGATTFNIALSRCVGAIATAAAYFEAGPGVDPVTRNIRNTATGASAATGVQFQLLDAAGQVIRAGETTQTSTTERTAVTASAATMPYSVRYITTAAATAGTVVGSVTYSINYQ